MEKTRQAANAAPYLNGILGVMIGCIRNGGFPVNHRLWTEILAVAARVPAVRAMFATSDKVLRAAFAELLRKAAEAGKIDDFLDFNAVSVWLYALVDGLIARTADDSGFDFQTQRETFEALIRRALCPHHDTQGVFHESAKR